MNDMMDTLLDADPDRIDDLIDAIMTDTTCGMACWSARERACRCSCGGRNHGIANRGGRAARTCKAGPARYELVAVVPLADGPYALAAEMAEQITGRRQHDFALRPSWGPPPAIAVQPATKAQQKWPEVAAFGDWRTLADGEAPIHAWRRRPHLIWRRIDNA